MTTLIILIALSIILDLLILYNRDKAFGPPRYHIDVPAEFWERTFGDLWTSGSDAERKGIRERFLKRVVDCLAADPGEAKAIMSESWIDYTGKRVGLVITRLDTNANVTDNPYCWLGGQLVDWARRGRAYLKRLFARPVGLTKPYFSLASPSPSQDPRGFLWVIVALFTTMLTIGMAALLFGCGKPEKPAQTRPTTVPRDSVRERLQREHKANLDTVKIKKERTSLTQKPYETAVSDFDSLRARLPR